MGITVSDLLKLPSLYHAEILAGSNGMNKIVSSVSILEPIENIIPLDQILPPDEYYYGEIFFTILVDAPSDISMFVRKIVRLSRNGATGLIIVNKEHNINIKESMSDIIKLADKLSFPVLNINNSNLRYGYIIKDVIETILKDQLTTESVVIELLDNISRLPEKHQSLEAVLKMLSDRLKASVIIADTSLKVINESTWPQALRGMSKRLSLKKFLQSKSPPIPFSIPGLLSGALLYHEHIEIAGRNTLELFIVREGAPLEKNLFQYAIETIKLTLQILDKQHEKVAISALFQAIMQNEVLKMHKLADFFHVKMSQIRLMWIFSAVGHANMTLRPIFSDIVNLVNPYHRVLLSDIYQEYFIILTDSALELSNLENLQKELIHKVPQNFIFVYFPITSVNDIRESYAAFTASYRDMHKIFPLRQSFSSMDVYFAKECRESISHGEITLQQSLNSLNSLRNEREFLEFNKTLTTYLLDANCCSTTTAEQLFIHKNTVKYRLRRISNYLGFRIGDMPATLKIYKAVAIERLLTSDKV